MMAWLKRGILFILSACLLSLAACQNKTDNYPEEKESVITAEDKVSSFFNEIKNWNDYSLENLNRLGTRIDDLDSSLQFHSNINNYELGAFIFSASHKKDLNIFTAHPFLKEDTPHRFSTYSVWRKKIKNLQLLDISIEPHPILEWILVIRLRQQE